MTRARAGPIPDTSLMRFGLLSRTSSVLMPKRSTMRDASPGPSPFISPEPRYLRIPSSVAGASSVKPVTRNCGPNRGVFSRRPVTRSCAPTGTPSSPPTMVSGSDAPSTVSRATVNAPSEPANTMRSIVPCRVSSGAPSDFWARVRSNRSMSRRPARLALFALGRPLLFRAAVGGARGDAQQLRAQALVATRVRQRRVDDPPLDLLQRRPHRERQRLAVAQRARSRAHLGRQIVSLDGGPARQHHRARDRVLQLADVARPIVAGHGLGGGAREAGQPTPVALGVELQEVLGPQRHVLAAIAQRRDRDGDDG